MSSMGLFRTVRFTGAWMVSRLNIKSERGATAVESQR
jgi:hypothetical protein